MRFTIAQLQAFFWTAQLGSLSKASAHLHLAQPTISLRLRDLEKALGAKLFQKNGRGLALTAEGIALVPRAGALREEPAPIRPQSDPAAIGGSIRIGFADGFAVTGLPKLLEIVRQDYP